MWRIREHSGFTLIELVIVAVIIGIIALFVAPLLNMDRALSIPGADVVAADIANTKVSAMTNNQSLCMNFGVGGSTYTYLGTYNPANNPACSGGTTRDLTQVGANVRVSAISTPLAGGIIAFNGKGEPYGLTGTGACTSSGAGTSYVTVSNGTDPNTSTATVCPYSGKVIQQ